MAKLTSQGKFSAEAIDPVDDKVEDRSEHNGDDPVGGIGEEQLRMFRAT